jgi:hypothetical protein
MFERGLELLIKEFDGILQSLEDTGVQLFRHTNLNQQNAPLLFLTVYITASVAQSNTFRSPPGIFIRDMFESISAQTKVTI